MNAVKRDSVKKKRSQVNEMKIQMKSNSSIQN